MFWFRKPKDPVQELREIIVRTVYLEKDKKNNDEVIENESFLDIKEAKEKYKLPSLMLMNCLTYITFKDLLNHIHGHWPVEYQHLFVFNGNIYRDNEIIPIEAYEIPVPQTEDEEIFRSRISICIDLSRPALSDNKQLNQAITNAVTDNLDIDDTSVQVKDIHDMIDTDALKAEAEANWHVEAPKKFEFDLFRELKLIQCHQYYVALAKAGYDNEGSFAYLTEDRLYSPSEYLYIPRRARIRILTLADTYKRKLEQEIKERKEDEERRLGHKTNVHIEINITGDETAQFKSKAELNRYYAKKAMGSQSRAQSPTLQDENQKINLSEAEDPNKTQVQSEEEIFEDDENLHLSQEKEISDRLDLLKKSIFSRFRIDMTNQELDNYLQIKKCEIPNTGIFCCEKHSQLVQNEKERIINLQKASWRGLISQLFEDIYNTDDVLFFPFPILYRILERLLTINSFIQDMNASNFLIFMQETSILTLEELLELDSYQTRSEFDIFMPSKHFVTKEKFINCFFQYIDQYHMNFYFSKKLSKVY